MMTKTQILELENNFKAYKTKLFIKKALFLSAMLLVVMAIFWAFELYSKKQETLKMALDEKNKMQKKLELAKIETQKAQILAKKQENLPAQDLSAKQRSKIVVQAYTMNDKALKKQFNKGANYKTALNLAHLYLIDKKYEEALFWSLKANELEKKDKDSWIIFAKAKFALGQKDEAKRALQNFMSFYGGELSQELDYILK